MKENSNRREQSPSSQSKAGRQGQQQQQRRGPSQQQWQQQAHQGQWSTQGQNFEQDRQGRPKGPTPGQYGAQQQRQQGNQGQSFSQQRDQFVNNNSGKDSFKRQDQQSINDIYARASTKQNQRQLSDKEEGALLQRNFEELTSAIKAVRVSIENKNENLYMNKPEEFKDNANHLAKVQALLLELETISAASEMMPALKDLTKESYHMRGALQDTEQKLLDERETWDVEFSINDSFQTPHWDYDNDVIDEQM
jgi:hypothetical protein